VPKCVVNMNFTNFNSIYFQIISITIISNVKKEWCTFDMQKRMLENKNKNSAWVYFECFKHVKGLLKHWQIESNIHYWNFAMNGAYSEKKFDNPNYCAPLVIFQKF
jgi:hypothetical protein